jgi:gliding motility-associated-like protein
VDTLPYVNFSNTTACLHDTTFFTNLSHGYSATIVSSQWNFGDGNSSTDFNPTHIYANPGSYIVTLSVTDDKGCSRSTQHNVIVNPLPVANFTANTVCFGNITSFSSTSTTSSGSIVTYLWDYGDGSPLSSGPNVTHLYADTGTFYVTHIVITNNGCRDTIVLPVRVNANPIADFVADTACAGSSTLFTDLSSSENGSINLWNWNFGDGGNSSTQNPSHIYANSGIYNAQLIVQNINGCIDTITHIVIVKPTPNANFSSNTVCLGTATNFYDASHHNSTNIVNWQWDFGDGVTSTFQNPSHIYGNHGIYNVSLIVENDMGCLDTINNNVLVYANPIADFVASVACIGFPTSFQDLSTPLGGSITTWQWDFGDGIGISNIQNPTWTYSTGTPPYNVSLIVTDTHGCTDSTTHIINLYPQPTALFTANNVCSNDTVNFIDQSYSSNGNIVGWHWDFDDGTGFSNLQNPNYLYAPVSVITTFNPVLIVTDNNGCTDTISNPITIFPQPIADFTADTVCSGNNTHFTDISSPVVGTITSWQWDFGDGSTSNLQNPQHLYNSVNSITSFNVSLIITNSYGCKDSIYKPVIVNPLPHPHFVANTACSGDLTIFTDLSYSNGGIITQWQWNFGDGFGTSNNQNPSYTYSPVYNPTNFNVTLNITDINGCTNDTSLSIVVNPLPVGDFSVNPTCSGYNSIFNDLSTSNGGNIIEWQWDFGDNVGTSNQQNPTYLYPTTSTIDYYTVTLVVKDINGCIDTARHQAMIIPSPNANFISDTVCSGNAAYFIDHSTTIGGTITGWQWNFGDGIGTSNQQNPSYLYLSVHNTTTYNVELIVTNSYGCKDTTNGTAMVYPLPIVNFNSNIACFGNPTQFTDLSNSAGGSLNSWQWDFGDGSVSNQQNPQHTYANYGYFPVSLTVTDINSCINDTTKNILVDSLPIPSFTWTPTCTQGIITFTNTSNGNGSNIISYLWDFGDGFLSNIANPIHYYFNTGTYNVSLAVTNNRGCSDSVNMLVNVNEGLNVDFYASDVCFGETMYFYYNLINPYVQPVTWLWSFGDGTYSTDPQPSHYYQHPGTYNVLLTVTDNLGCDLTITHQVTVFTSPLANFSANIAQIGNPTIFTDLSTTANGNLISWQWSFGDGSSSNQQNPQHFYNNAGNYLVTLIVINNFGCADTFSLNVLVTEVISVDFTMMPNPVCINQPVYFTDISSTGSGNFISWHWDFGDGYISTSQNPIHSYKNPGNYNVSLIATTSLNLSDTAVHSLTVVDAPIANFIYEPLNPILSENVYFTDLSVGATQWYWNLGDDTYSYVPNPIHTYYNLGLYSVSLIVTNEYGCRDTAYQTVIPYDNDMIYFPNAIHINGDGINDIFNVVGTGWSPDNFELRIFNRWGEQIYFTTDINAGWDGTDARTGEKVQIGVYVWKVQIMDFANNVKKYVGYVTVLL